jgi:hypothetical protein
MGEDAGAPSGGLEGGLMTSILLLHRNNIAQWDREDDARRHQANDAVLAAAKRDIDRLNKSRHAYIEEIDHAIANIFELRTSAPLATESPGLAIDRLSVLVIRLASMERPPNVEGPAANEHGERLRRARAQLDALKEALASLLSDLADGTRRFHRYESVKVYGAGGSDYHAR